MPNWWCYWYSVNIKCNHGCWTLTSILGFGDIISIVPTAVCPVAKGELFPITLVRATSSYQVKETPTL